MKFRLGELFYGSDGIGYTAVNIKAFFLVPKLQFGNEKKVAIGLTSIDEMIRVASETIEF